MARKTAAQKTTERDPQITKDAMRNPPTMKDVAAEAGVSLGTVSKVFNHLAVGEHYQKRVLAAAEKLGYRVNSYARAMKSGKTETIALILPDLRNQFFGELAEWINEALRKKGYRMLIYLTHSRAEDEVGCLELASEFKVDGIIALTYSSDLRIAEGVNLVTIDRHVPGESGCITSDNYGGGMMAAQKLMELGCKKLLGVQISSCVISEVNKRIDGFRAACSSAGVSFDICQNMEDSEEMVLDYLYSHLHEGRFDFDGVFCSNDELAYRFHTRLERAGIRVPEDVQIIGFDGIRKFGYQDLFCSTIVQPVKEIADMAVEQLLKKDSSPHNTLVCLPVVYAPGTTTRD